MAQKHTQKASHRRPVSGGFESTELGILSIALGLFAARLAFPAEAAATHGDGQLLVVAWIALASAWLIAAARRGPVRLRWELADWLLAGLLAWHSLAGLAALRTGAPRPALNMLWEWVGLGAAWFVFRQTLSRPPLARAAVAVGVGAGVFLAAYAFYQFGWELPWTRAEYARAPEEMLKEVGISAPPGSPERFLFEQRLASLEPVATFALTNSLAGYLVAWAVAALGAGVVTALARRPPTAWIAPLAAAAVMGLGLVLTKSRSGYLAGLASAGILAVYSAARGWPLRRAAGAGLGILLGGAVVLAGLGWLGAIDLKLLTEARKSLGYRLEYWESTAALIADHPWLGVGPGNFQANYPRYKLPQASENIADPHNLLFEVGATAGLPALAMLVAALAAVGWSVVRARGTKLDTVPEPVDPRWVVLGGAVGFAASWLLGPWTEVPPSLRLCLVGGLAISGVGALHGPWIVNGRFPSGAALLAAGALALNLQAGGALAFPSLSGSLLLLLALSLNLASPGATVTLPKSFRWPLGLGGLCLAVLCWSTSTWPGYRMRQLDRRARDAAAKGDGFQAENLLLAGAAADPRALEPWNGLAELRFQAWRAQPTADGWQRFEQAAARMLALDPHSAPGWSQVGIWRLAAYRAGEASALAGTVEAFRRAVELFPNRALGHARLAWALSLAGDPEAAAQAARALELDGLNPHAEQKLARQKLEDPQAPSGENAEQAMRRLASPPAAN
ncbi:MAG: O-antigen ligase family protein [Pirellulales bacterium]